MITARIIFNPVAGQVSTHQSIERAVSIFESFGWQVDLVASQSGSHTEEIASEAAADNLDVVIVAGGDGSIRQTAAGLQGSDTALGILPAGSANVWARDLHMPRLSRFRPNALEKSAELLANGKIQDMDLGKCGGVPFLLWSGIGIDGSIVHERESNRQGRRYLTIPRYILTAASEARTWKGMDLTLTIDGQEKSGHYQMAVVNNIHSYAGGLVKISPQACLDDGQMDLWLFSGDNAYHLFWLLLSGNHVKSPLVEHVAFRSLSITTDSEISGQLDGDPFTFGRQLEISVIPAGIRVLVPENVPDDLFSNPGRKIRSKHA